MPYQLNFEKFLAYNVGDEGVGLEVEIRFGDSTKRGSPLPPACAGGSRNTVWRRRLG